MLRLPSRNNMSNIRDLFTRDHKEKVPPDLRRALDILRLSGFEELEERFLSLEAFLRPWSMFRDCMFLLFPDAMPRTTTVVPFGNENIKGVSRLGILWFYTQFDEGTLRYDPRADIHNAAYTTDTAVYGMIDKSKWGMEEYEKHLFAWLLQELKVGKGYNPWRFECFELTNICTVWEAVLVPIIDAVRASYSPGGRRNYGRLALFIEARCPSQLAFPGSNVVAPPTGGLLSPTPYRMVSMMRPSAQIERAGVMTKKQYDTAERELRDVYPQYGGLVERPKFKHKMEEWLAEQRARAEHRRGIERHGEVRTSLPQIVQHTPSSSPVKQPQSPRGSLSQRHGNARDGSESPMKRYAEGLKRSLSNVKSSMRYEEKKSPMHGVTRQLQFPDRTREVKQESWSELFGEQRESFMIAPLPRPPKEHRDSEMSVYSTVQTSYPFTDTAPRPRAGTVDSVFSPMAQLSAIPRPLEPEPDISRDLSSDVDVAVNDRTKPTPEEPQSHTKVSYYEVRMPSYEGTDYEREISLTALHNHRKDVANGTDSTRKRTPATRLPAPIVPVPYSGPRTASADTPTRSTAAQQPATVASPPKPVPIPTRIPTAPKASDTPSKPSTIHPPLPVLSPQKVVATPAAPAIAPTKPVAWPGPVVAPAKSVACPGPDSTKPRPIAWPGADSGSDDNDLTPPIPSRSPERQIRNPRARKHQRRRDSEQEVYRIVSRENIRAALGNYSPESSTEELVPPKKPFSEQANVMSPNKHQLRTYNSHLFPKRRESKGWQDGAGGEGAVGVYETDGLLAERKK